MIKILLELVSKQNMLLVLSLDANIPRVYIQDTLLVLILSVDYLKRSNSQMDVNMRNLIQYNHLSNHFVLEKLHSVYHSSRDPIWHKIKALLKNEVRKTSARSPL